MENAARTAEAVIVSQVVDAVESQIARKGLSLTSVVTKSGLSRREVGLLRKLAVRPRLSTLLAFVEAVGLELRITVRSKHGRQPIDGQEMR